MSLDRLTGKRVVSALVALPALVLLLAATRPWLSGRSAEPLLGGGAVTATGTQLTPGVAALALVALVALVTTLTGGRVVRRVSSVAMLLAAVGAFLLTLGPLRDPETALGRVAAAGLGRTGVVRTTADVSGWAWTAVVASVVLVCSSVLALVAAGRWGGLSRRFDSPAEETASATSATSGDTTAAPAETAADARSSAWEDLSSGVDPTLDGADRAPTLDAARGTPDQAGAHTPASGDAERRT